MYNYALHFENRWFTSFFQDMIMCIHQSNCCEITWQLSKSCVKSRINLWQQGGNGGKGENNVPGNVKSNNYFLNSCRDCSRGEWFQGVQPPCDL